MNQQNLKDLANPNPSSISLATVPILLVHLERALCGRESGVFNCGGFEDGLDAEKNNNNNNRVGEEEDGDVGEEKDGGHISSECAHAQDLIGVLS